MIPAPVARLLQSSKALVVLSVVVGAFLAFHFGRATWEEATSLVKWVMGPWLLAQGVEDAAKHYGASKSDASTAVVESAVAKAVAASLPPPAADSSK